MAWINNEAYKANLAGLQAMFTERLEDLKTVEVDQLSMTVPSTAPSEMYHFLDGMSGLTEWVGDRDVDDIKSQSLTVANKTYQKAINIPRDDLADDRLKLAQNAITGLARKVVSHYVDIVTDALLDAPSTVCYDGKMVAADDHPMDDGSTWANLTDAVLSSNAFSTVFEAMESRRGPAGNILDITPTHLVVGPSNRSVAEGFLNVQYIGGNSNPLFQRVKLIVSKRYTGAHAAEWTLVDASRPELMPVLLQIRQGAELAMDEPFLRKEILAGVDCRDAAAVSMPQLIYHSTGDAQEE